MFKNNEELNVIAQEMLLKQRDYENSTPLALESCSRNRESVMSKDGAGNPASSNTPLPNDTTSSTDINKEANIQRISINRLSIISTTS